MDKKYLKDSGWKKLNLSRNEENDPFCLHSHTLKCAYPLIREISESNEHFNECYESCKVPCEFWEYTTSMSSSRFPSTQFVLKGLSRRKRSISKVVKRRKREETEYREDDFYSYDGDSNKNYDTLQETGAGDYKSQESICSDQQKQEISYQDWLDYVVVDISFSSLQYTEITQPEGPTFEAQQLNDCNWIVANCTTPASCFTFYGDKWLCHLGNRHPDARSSLDEFVEGTFFQRMIPERGLASKNPDKVERVVFCTGKIYYDLVKARAFMAKEERVVIARLEQISPFPYDLIKGECNRYPRAELLWAQEEHKNMGPWGYVQPRFLTMLEGQRQIKYAGRVPSASPATGNKYQHYLEQKTVLADTLNVSLKDLRDFH